MNRSVTEVELDGVDTSPPPPALPAGLPAPALRELSGRLAGLTLWQQVFTLAIWPFFEQMLNFLIGAVDTILAGHMHPDAVSATEAIAVGAYVGWGVSLVQVSVGVGASAIVARAIGGRHRRAANATMGQSLVMALAVGILIGGTMYVAARAVSSVMGTSGLSLDFATQYLRILCLAAPASGVLFVGSACLRAAGDTRSPFTVLAIVNVVNAVVSAALVYAPAPIGGHRVAGIALGTAVAWAVGACLILWTLVRGNAGIRLRLFRLRPHWHTMVRIVRVGLPNLFESLSFWTGNFLVVTFVGVIGSKMQPGALAAHVIGVRVEAISYLPAVALAMAASTLTGQYLGLGDPHRAKRAALLCCAVGVCLMGSMGLLFWFAPGALVSVVTSEKSLLDMAPHLLRICAPVQVFFATSIVLSNAMRGAGATRSTMLVSSFSVWCVRVPAAYVLGVVMGYGLNGIWFALCGELVLRGTLFGIQFARGKWAKVEV
jgi:MATE family, multidrug efflux pump